MRNYALILFVIFFSCGQDDSIPDYCIPQNDFVTILYGMEMIDAVQIQSIEGKKQTDSVTFAQYKFLFDSLQIRKAQFDSSFQFYQKNPDLILEITDSLVARLSREEEIVSKELRDTRWRSNKEKE